MVRSIRWLWPPAIVLAVCLIYRAAAHGPEQGIVLLRDAPWHITPLYDQGRIVSDQQLGAVLRRMIPRSTTRDTNLILHALRLWGAQAQFTPLDAPNPEYGVLSGGQMQSMLLSDKAFRQHMGPHASPLLQLQGERVEVRPWQAWDERKQEASVHVNDILATFAETNVPLSHPLITRDGVSDVRHMLLTALLDYNGDQFEYEWTSISYARYVFPTLQWTNRFAEQITVDALVDQLIDKPWRLGVCGGTHRLEALVVLYRADEQAHMLSKRTRTRILNHLASVSARLVQSQNAGGFWDKTWPDSRATGSENQKNSNSRSHLSERILATGHHLEWLALAPAEVLPPREVLVRASQWLVSAMLEVDDATLQRYYGPFSHAARALTLWRGEEAYATWQRLAFSSTSPTAPTSPTVTARPTASLHAANNGTAIISHSHQVQEGELR